MKKLVPAEMWAKAKYYHDLYPPKVIEIQKPWGKVLGIDLTPPMPKCNMPLTKRPGQCSIYAGGATGHFGVGACRLHRGNFPRGHAEGFMIMAIAYARKLRITPAQALLDEVHRSAAAVNFLQDILSKVETEEELLGEANRKWVDMYERERAFGVKVNLAAITAGTMQLMDEYETSQGMAVARLIRSTLGELELSPEQEARAYRLIAARVREISDVAQGLDNTPSVDISTGEG